MNLGRYSKVIAALVAGAIGFATLVVNSPAAHISAQEWIVGATYLATALGVFVVPNQQPLTDNNPGD
jgi:L-serine deaminase